MTKTGWFFTLPLLFILSGFLAALANGYEWLQIRQYCLWAAGGSALLWLTL